MSVKPWIGYITIIDVEHEDEVKVIETGVPDDSFFAQALGVPTEQEIKQGIAAGVVVETGEGVPDLDNGCKVYYAERTAITIGEFKVVHSKFIVAWEPA